MILVKDLPEEYKLLILKRTDKELRDLAIEGSRHVAALFKWDESPEGYEWWRKVADAETLEELPPIPVQGGLEDE